MAYLLDANVFISAKNLHYGFDFCPAFWQWLDDCNANGMVFSIAKVGDEVQAGADDLATWAASRGARFFLPISPGVVPSLATVSAWATGQSYDLAAVSTFLSIADYYLVSQAHAGSHTVVTHEKPAASPKKIKIPDACIGLGIRCITPYEMLRNERARFVLGPGDPLRWVPFIGQIRPLTSLTPDGRNRVRSQCRPDWEFCLPESCEALHGNTSTGSGPG